MQPDCLDEIINDAKDEDGGNEFNKMALEGDKGLKETVKAQLSD